MRQVIFATLGAAAIGLGGCQSLQGYPAPLETPKQALDLVKADTQPAAVTAYAALTDPDQRRTRRDQIVRARLYAIDVNYDDFVRTVSGQQKAFAVGADLVSAGLTGAATLAKSAATKTHLTTYASAALGVRATVDKELFYSKTLPAVISQMDASRKVVLAKIAEGLAQPDSNYSLVEALADLQDYYAAGTLNGALNQISKDAGAKSAVAQQKIENVTTIKYATDAVHTSLVKYWQPHGQFDSAHEQILLSCTPVPPGATPTVNDMGAIVDDGSASQRKALANCVKKKDPDFN
jgi:hypothetical protein